MITLEAYRAAIGTFYGKACSIQIVCDTRDDYETFQMLRSSLSFKTFWQTFIVVALIFIIELNLNMAFLKFILLLRDGDIESNPGPTYNFIKSVQGNFNQANIKYGNSAGTQCVANALYAIVWSAVYKVYLWTSWDLDYILDNGDDFYKSMHATGAIAFDELPNSITVEGVQLDMTFLDSINGELTMSQSNFLQFNEVQTGIMFMTSGFTTSILRNKSHIFIFDSHSRRSDGFFTANGYSVLLKFRKIADVENYVKEIYLCHQNKISIYYQIQPVKVDLSKLQSAKISTCARKKREKYSIQSDKIKAKRKEHYAAQQEKIKAKKREHYTAQHENIKLKRKKHYAAKHEHVKLRIKQRYIAEQENIKVRRKEHYAVEHENIKLKRKYHYKASQESIKSSRKEYYAINAESIKFKRREHYKIERNSILSKKKESYANNSEKMNKQACKRYLVNKCTSNTSDRRILNFKNLIQEGPYYICVVCNRCLYKRSVSKFKEENYNISALKGFEFFMVLSYDGQHYVCQTCHKKLKSKKPQIPCQAVSNKLEIVDFPPGFPQLRKLEQVLIAQRLLFKKVAIMPKGQCPKLKGAICNVPVENTDICDVLPRPADCNGLILIKLKRKLMYNGHVYFEPVRPQVLSDVLEYLKLNNPLYQNTTIDMNGIPPELLSFNEDAQLEIIIDNGSKDVQEDDKEEEENPLDQYRAAALY